MGSESDIELGNTEVSKGELRQRKKRKLSDSGPPVATRPFVGRIGGNQEFTVSPDASDFTRVTSKAPDAAANFTWQQSFNLQGFKDPELWKEATIEGIGACAQTYIGGLYSMGLAPALTATALGPITPAVFGSIATAMLIVLFIFAGGPVSGGHFNPLITLATFTTRLSTFPRTVLYVSCQCVGGVVAGWILRGTLGLSAEAFRSAPGCFFDSELVTPGQAYGLETMTAFVLVFIAFGVALDPRQRDTLGPALSSILVGMAIMLCTFASGIARPGYSGAAMNPARCLGLMSAAEKFDYHYVHWAGAFTATGVNGFLYWLIPPYKNSKN
ncbi:aquaporin-like protein [Periconia macrospinosa]|uniref:Aquaporin-like protein n=1 Tax=Periconia macrospinosa TaxID=97972 RepID=A0A2V1DXK6_9PLEO|nr:aquaporin-like protein [Periconia macrospinosa]